MLLDGGTTEAPGPKYCFDVTTHTKDYGHENDWKISCTDESCKPCVNEEDFENDNQYTQECCLPQDQTEFFITCIDEWGDGWHGGYLEVGGTKYCSNFTTGTEYQETLIIEGGGTEGLIYL